MPEPWPVKANEGAVVYLLDVSFFTFRAYYALPELNTSDGIPTNAVHGVATMLDRLIRIQQPTHIAACFDSPGKTFRNDIYPAYKANRDEPDEELKTQFPLVERLIAAMAIPGVRVDRYEADDLLGTLAKKLSAAGAHVVIVTGDKDLMQCVNDSVSLYDPVRNKRVREAEVLEKFGVPPSGVTDVQGLMGDSTDNIPGVRGVGPKTATALISEFGSLEKLLERTEEIEGMAIRGAKGVRKKVEEGAEDARLSKRLATVCDDIPLDLELDDLAFESPHTRELIALAEELEMTSLAARVRAHLDEREGPEQDETASGTDDAPSDDATPGEAALPGGGCAASGDADLFGAQWQELTGGEVAFVVAEDQDAEPMLALSQDGKRALVVGQGSRGAIAALIKRGASFSGHDVKGLCRRYHVQPGPESLDVGVASYLYDASAGSHDASDVVKRFLGETSCVPAPLGPALAACLEQLERLLPVMRGRLEEHGQAELYATLERPLLGVLADIEERGIQLDVKLLGRLSKEFGKRMETLVGRIYEAAGSEFNILSPLQLRQVLFENLGLPTKGVKKTKTGLSTDSETLRSLAEHHELPALILEYRALAKLRSTYVDALPRLVDGEGRIHTRLNQTVTATGRLSSNDPNLQNIPIRTEDGARIRRAFVARSGCVLLSADYNQIELRVLAHLSGDDTLCEAFRKGEDIHRATAADVFGVDAGAVTPEMRRYSKVINYGIIYGMGSVRMSRELGISRSAAADYIKRYFDRYPGVKRFYAEMLDQARSCGYVSTLMGRRRYLADIESDHGGRRQMAERVATNTPIQGSAADIIKLAMVELFDSLSSKGLESAMVLQIHDELLLECPEAEVVEAERLTRGAMESAMQLVVPVVVDVGTGRTWAEAH